MSGENRGIAEITGYKYRYFVTDAGDVYSMFSKRKPPRKLKATPNNTGHYRVNLVAKDGTHKQVFVHRLVALYFIENPYGLDVVNHKDFDPSNNAAENLEWTTRRGNYKYSFNKGRYKRTKMWRDNLKSSLVKKMGRPVICTDIKTGSEQLFSSVNETKAHGFQPSSVCCCCSGKRMTHKGKRWRYADA